MIDGIKNAYFYPELCERLFEGIRVSEGRLSLETAVPISEGDAVSGGFGDVYCVGDWFKPMDRLPNFPRYDSNNDAEREKRCCIKVLRRLSWNGGSKTLWENEEAYAHRCYEEYELLRKANGASGSAPRPLAFGAVVGKGLAEEHESNWAVCMEYLSTGGGTYYLNAHDAITSDRCGFVAGASSPREVASLAYALCIALLDLHVTGVSHRDIQPKNVAARFTQKDGNKVVDRVYLIDLGNSAEFDSDVTQVDGGNGSVRLAHRSFGAPEMFAIKNVNDKYGRLVRREPMDYYDQRNKQTVDVWSYGAILYYYSTRRYPVTKNDGTTSYYELYTEPKKQGLSIRGHLWKGGQSDASRKATEFSREIEVLNEIVEGCTKYNPADRPRLEDIKTKLESLLGIKSTEETRIRVQVETISQSPSQTVRYGKWEMNILLGYKRVRNNKFFAEYERDVGNQTYRIMLSCDYDVPFQERDGYVKKLAERIGRLYGTDGLVLPMSSQFHTMKAIAGIDQKDIIAFEVLEDVNDKDVFLSEHCLCFMANAALRVGITCRANKETQQDVKADLNRELAQAVQTLRRA